MSERRCAVLECERPYSSKGYCKMHAERVRRHGDPGGSKPRAARSMAERLAAMIDSSPGPAACWPFIGSTSAQGYGRIRTGGAGSPTIGAHRAAFLLANPTAGDPEVIDHLCHDPLTCHAGDECPHRRCCNPDHLAASTVAENSAADRQWTRAQLTHCANGHEFTEANTYTWTDQKGYVTRTCRPCAAEHARRRRAS